MSTDRVGMVVAAMEERAASWRRMAAFLKDNPDIAKSAHVHEHAVLRPCELLGDPLGFIVDAASRAQAAGARVEEYSNGGHGGIRVYFGPVYLQVYAGRDRVCEPVTVGMVPDVRYRLSMALDGITAEGGGDQ